MSYVRIEAALVLCALAGMAGCAGATPKVMHLSPQVRTDGFVQRQIEVEGRPHTYLLYVPSNYSANEKWPCVIFLHGSGECGREPERAAAVGLGPAIRSNPTAWRCLVAFPQKPTSATEWEENEELVLGILEDVRRHYCVDDARIVLTGLSQGGHGTWMIGARHPTLWSCLVPVCGYGQPLTTAPRVYRLPIWAFHGQDDSVVPVDQTVRIVEAVRQLQKKEPVAVPIRATIYPGVNHNSWERAYGDPKLAGWMLSHVRNPEPSSEPASQ